MSTITTLEISNTQFLEAIEELRQFVAIPSVSHTTSPFYSSKTLSEAAQFPQKELEKLGFDTQLFSVENSAPYVVAKKIFDTNKLTVVLYGHYDVQPVDTSKWTSEPFVLEERDGRLYGRGASDDKAGIITILSSLKVLMKANQEFCYNVTVFLEGEEECGSPHLLQFMKEHANKIQGAALIVMDGMNRAANTGTLMSSTRGLVNLSVTIEALKKPQHSGIACLVPDPSMALAELVASLAQPRNIPEFMDDAIVLDSKEKAILAESSITSEKYASQNGVVEGGKLRGDPEVSIYERVAFEPSISIVNMVVGEIGGGNSIQNKAECTIGIRITAGQDPDRIADCVSRYLKGQTITGNLPVKIEKKETAHAWKGSLSSPLATRYMNAMKGYFLSTCAEPCGGALPLLKIFRDMFPTMEMIVPGVEDPDTSAHSHDESQNKVLFRSAINSLIAFLQKK